MNLRLTYEMNVWTYEMNYHKLKVQKIKIIQNSPVCLESIFLDIHKIIVHFVHLCLQIETTIIIFCFTKTNQLESLKKCELNFLRRRFSKRWNSCSNKHSQLKLHVHSAEICVNKWSHLYRWYEQKTFSFYEMKKIW